MKSSASRVLVLSIALTCTGACPALAAMIFERGTSAPILQIDPSDRSAAMGSASTAVFWGLAPNAWANPAVLGYTQGVRWEQGTGNYDLADFGLDTEYRAARATVGGGGLGFVFTGRPIEGLGKIDFESSTVFEFTGLPPLVLRGTERVRSWGVGASVAQLIETLARSRGGEPPALLRHVDLALGYNHKHVEERVAIGDSSVNELTEQAEASDRGFLLRAGASPFVESWGTTRVEGAYGYSEISYEEPTLGAGPLAHDWRNGAALHLSYDRARSGRLLPEWMAPGLKPLVSLGLARDWVRTTQNDYGDPHHIDEWGAELEVANLVFGRVGQSHSSSDGSVRHDWGVGVGLPLGAYGGVRWDHANLERGTDLPDVARDTWTFWIQPFAVYDAMR